MQRIPQVWPGWQADELIGQGSFGRVYRASRTAGGHTSVAAIKVIDIPQSESEVATLTSMGMDALSIRSYFEETARSVVREIALMDELKGAPGVVHIEDYQLLEREDGVGWTVLIRMELLDPLSKVLVREGLPDMREAARIGIDICQGLAHCHEHGLIHRDVKPENVFRTHYGEYRLGDFGLARRIEEGSRSTMSHAGTGAFMAPEVMSGHYDHRVDIYSLGLMLYRWLNGGRPPFIGADETPSHAMLDEANHKRLSGRRPPLPEGPDVDRALAAIVCKAAEPKPADRWQTAQEFGEALQAWLDGKGGSAVAGQTEREPETTTGGSDYDPLSTLKKVGETAAKDEEPKRGRDGGVTARPDEPTADEVERGQEAQVKDDGLQKEKAPGARRNPAGNAALVVVRIALTAAACYLIYLLFSYTIDESFQAAHPVLHWIMSWHGIFWWILDPMLIGAIWVDWWKD